MQGVKCVFNQKVNNVRVCMKGFVCDCQRCGYYVPSNQSRRKTNRQIKRKEFEDFRRW